jgi:hypothetical protein
MPILTDPAEARRRLIDLLDADCDPALDTSMSEAVKSTGGLVVVTRPTDGDTLMVGGKVYSFVSGDPGIDDIQSSVSLNTTAQNILARINADTLTTLCLATRNNATLILTANTAGTAGNSIDLEPDGVRITSTPFSGGAAEVTEDDISRLLDEFKVGSVWVAVTAYAIGDVVIPATSNGHRFVCVKAGTSGAAEPAWTSSQESRFSDNDVTWEEAGLEVDLWDLRAAAHRGWMMKAAKASQKADVRIGDNSKSKSQIYSHCIEMATRYTPISIG